MKQAFKQQGLVMVFALSYFMLFALSYFDLVRVPKSKSVDWTRRPVRSGCPLNFSERRARSHAKRDQAFRSDKLTPLVRSAPTQVAGDLLELHYWLCVSGVFPAIL